MSKLIDIKTNTRLVAFNATHNEATVKVSTIVNFSGNTKESIQKNIKTNFDRLVKLGLKYPYSSTEDLNYSEIEFNDKSAMFLLTLLKNTDRVLDFKENLIEEFFTMREAIAEQDSLIAKVKEETLVKYHKEELDKVKAEKKKLNTYAGGMISVRKFKQESDLDVGTDYMWDALEHTGLVHTDIIPTKFRRLDKDASDLMASTITGTSGTPIFLPNVIENAVIKYTDYLNSVEPAEEQQEEV